MIERDEYRVSQAHYRQFHADGYVTLRAVLTEAEIQAIEPDFTAFIQGEIPGMGRDFCDMSGP